MANWRPYAEEAKSAGVKGFQQIQAQDLTPLVTAANNVGWNLDFMLANAQFYDPKASRRPRRRSSRTPTST